MNIGSLRYRVALDNPGTPVPDGDGGYTEVWAPLSPPEVWAAIIPATARDLERVVANAVQSMATHIITIRYHAGVTQKTRVTKGPRNADGSLAAGSREFHVTGIQNPGEQFTQLNLVCTELLS